MTNNAALKTQYQTFGDVNIHRLALISGDGRRGQDLTSFFINLSFTEDIFTNTVRGEIAIEDTIDMLTTLPIIGEELLFLSYSIPGKGNIVTKAFSVYDVANVSMTPLKKSRSFTIKFATPEQITNTYKRLNKTFTGLVSDSVATILKNDIGTAKNIDIEQTAGAHKAIMTNWSPFKCIQYLQKKAVSSDSNPSAFLFFENKDGFKFKTITSLVVDGLVNYNEEEDSYKYFIATETDKKNTDFYNIVELKIEGPTNTVNKIKSGAFNSTVKQLDLLNKKINRFDYSHYTDKSTIQTGLAAKDRNTDIFIESVSDTPAIELFVTYNPENTNDSDIAEVVPKRMAQLAHLRNFKMVAVAAGDTKRTAGDVISIEVPKVTGLTTTDIEKTDELYSGKYIVSAVKHTMEPGRYVMTMNLLRIESPKNFNRVTDNE